VLGDKQARSGGRISISPDRELQRAAEKALDGREKGAIVAMDPQTGAILAMAVARNCDPHMSRRAPTNRRVERTQQTEAPMLKRVAAGLLARQHLFKVITAVGRAGYRVASTQNSERFFIPPKSFLLMTAICLLAWARVVYRQHRLRPLFAHGLSSNKLLLTRLSCTSGGEAPCFYGPDPVRAGASGQLPTGIELDEEESAGLLGDPAWKLEKDAHRRGGPPLTSITFRSIGQGAHEGSHPG